MTVRTALSAVLLVLVLLALGAGLVLGLGAWNVAAAGQLESEIQDNGWLHCPADPDLIFVGQHE